MKFDAMGAITGPYGTAILEGLLGFPRGTVMNGTRCRISAATIPIPTSFMPRNSRPRDVAGRAGLRRGLGR